MFNDPKLKEKLHQFLEQEDRRRLTGKTLEDLHLKQDAMMGAVRKSATETLKVRQTQARHGNRIGKLEHQVALLSNTNHAVPNWQPDPAEITGTFEYKKLHEKTEELEARLDEEAEREREERRESKIWWRRQGWIWAFAIITLLSGGMLNACATYVLHRVETMDNPKK